MYSVCLRVHGLQQLTEWAKQNSNLFVFSFRTNSFRWSGINITVIDPNT